jgi:hypothetical protein
VGKTRIFREKELVANEMRRFFRRARLPDHTFTFISHFLLSIGHPPVSRLASVKPTVVLLLVAASSASDAMENEADLWEI